MTFRLSPKSALTLSRHRLRRTQGLPLLALSALFGASCDPAEIAHPTPIASQHSALTITLTDCLPASLITAINQANMALGPSTITLMGGCTYTLVARDNFWYGPNGLPSIVSDITIDGTQQGAIIERSSVAATPTFRLFYVGGTTLPPKKPGKLTLKNLTLRGGLAQGGASSRAGVTGGGGLGAGGAIFAHGDVTLSGVTLTGNSAVGGASANPANPGGAVLVCGGGGGMGGDAFSAGGGGFRPAINNNGGGGVGVGGAEGGKAAASAAVAGVGGTDASGTEVGSPAANVNGGAGGGTSTLGGAGAPGIAPAVGGVAGDGGGGGGGRAGSVGGGGGAGFGGNGGNGGMTGGGGGGGFGGGGGASAGTAGGGGGGVGGGGGAGVAATAGGAGGGGFGGGGGACLSGGKGGFGGGGGGANAAAPAVAGTGGYGGGSGIRLTGNGASGGGGLGAGGAVFVQSGTLTVVNSTLTGNTATGGAAGTTAVAANRGTGGNGSGGAIFSLNGTVTLLNSTLAANTVAGGAGSSAGVAAGGAFYSLAFGPSTMGIATLRNSILAASVGGPDLFAEGIQSGVTIDASGPNIVMTKMLAMGGLLSGMPQSADPMLGPLADNTGPARTMAISASSPAAGAGDPTVCTTAPVLAVDERGQPRTCQCDLGAFALPKVCPLPDLSGGTDDGGTDDGGAGGTYTQISGGGIGCSTAPVATGTSAGPLTGLALLGAALFVRRKRQES